MEFIGFLPSRFVHQWIVICSHACSSGLYTSISPESLMACKAALQLLTLCCALQISSTYLKCFCLSFCYTQILLIHWMVKLLHWWCEIVSIMSRKWKVLPSWVWKYFPCIPLIWLPEFLTVMKSLPNIWYECQVAWRQSSVLTITKSRIYLSRILWKICQSRRHRKVPRGR